MNYRSLEEYGEAVHVLSLYGTCLLFDFAKHDLSVRDLIIRNFIARSIRSINGILVLWQYRDYHDCWMLHRCLMDRLFHLWDLVDNDAFEAFDDWSFKEQYEYNNAVRSDPERKHEALNPTQDQKGRYNALKGNPPQWQRPDAERVAKRHDLRPLYKYGYHYACMHVHPMSNDGDVDFLEITGLGMTTPGHVEFMEKSITAVHNSCGIATVIIQEGLNASTLKWRSVVYDFLDHFRGFLADGGNQYQATFYKIGKMKQGGIPLATPGDAAS